MNPPNAPLSLIIDTVAILVITLVLMLIMLSRYTKVGPNQVLVVSGAKRHLPDGTVVGYRIVKGGGTFVWPLIERTDVLSLEVMTVEMNRSNSQTADGRAVEADCVAQVKVNGDDTSMAAAAEHFLSKGQAEIKTMVQPLLEKHLSSVFGNSRAEEAVQNPAACAAQVQTSASADLSKMGLSLVSFTIRKIDQA